MSEELPFLVLTGGGRDGLPELRRQRSRKGLGTLFCLTWTMTVLMLYKLLFASFLFSRCISFNPVISVTRVPPVPRITNNLAPVLQHPSSQLLPRRPTFIFEQNDESKDPEGTETKETDEVAASDADASLDGENENRNVATTVLLTVPLFCKFVAVLLIKFVTDLIVFPLLFLYRMAGITKRKVLKMLGKDPATKEKPNGAQ